METTKRIDIFGYVLVFNSLPEFTGQKKSRHVQTVGLPLKWSSQKSDFKSNSETKAKGIPAKMGRVLPVDVSGFSSVEANDDVGDLHLRRSPSPSVCIPKALSRREVFANSTPPWPSAVIPPLRSAWPSSGFHLQLPCQLGWG